VFSAYVDEALEGKLSEAHIQYDIKRLSKFWGKRRVSQVNFHSCKEYVAHRNGLVSSGKELAYLTAAMRHWHKRHGPLKVLPIVDKPAPPEARIHYMTRTQAAAFLWKARRSPHLARFFIIGWYTGSRKSVICGLRWSMVNLKSGIMMRKPPGAKQAKNKKAPPVRMGDRLMSHMRRWKRLDGEIEVVLHYRGKPIKGLTSSWDQTRVDAKLPAYVTPHVLRHTRATYMMKEGVDPWEASKALGMSVATLEKHYGHHHPSWQKESANVR
jgi:integrase